MAGRRPEVYTRAVADQICALMAEGMSMRSIVKMPGMPDKNTVVAWDVRDTDGFSARYAAAKEERIHALAEQVLSIADGTDGAEGEERDPAIRRLRFDARRWYASKIMPKQYGEKFAHEISTTTAAGASDADLLAIAVSGGGAGSASAEGED